MSDTNKQCVRTSLPLPCVPGDLEAAVSVLRRALASGELFPERHLKGNHVCGLFGEEEVNKLADELKQYGVTSAARGIYRIAFMLGKEWVLKCTPHAALQASTDFEFDARSTFDSEDCRHLPESYDLGGGIVLQRFYELNRNSYLASDELYPLVVKYSLDDMHDANVGFDKNGELVLIDFCTKEIHDFLHKSLPLVCRELRAKRGVEVNKGRTL